MKKIANVNELTHEQWLDLRKKSVGGSDAGSCVGMNPWKDRLTLWADKKGMLPEVEDNERMRLGRDLEQYVADRFMEATGKKVQRTSFMYCHDDYDFITAHIDRVVVGENAALECKTISENSKYDLENGEIPQQYYCQCQHYMMVLDYDYMYIALLKFGRGLYIHKIERNQADIDELLKAEVEFWNEYVVKDVQPEADGSDSAAETIQHLHPIDNGQSISLFDADNTINDLLEVQAAKKRLEKQEKAIKNILCEKLGDYTEGTSDKYIVTWKAQSRTSVDSKLLKANYPEVYEKVTKESTTRVLRTKEVKQNN